MGVEKIIRERCPICKTVWAHFESVPLTTSCKHLKVRHIIHEMLNELNDRNLTNINN